MIKLILLKQAKSLEKEERWNESKLIYEKLLKKDKYDGNINYRLGFVLEKMKNETDFKLPHLQYIYR